MPDPTKPEMMKLFAAVYDQTATEAEYTALDQWLRDNPDGQQQYLKFMDMQHEIERRIIGITPNMDAEAIATIDHSGADRLSRRTSVNRSTAVIVGLAASLLLMAGALFWTVNQTQDGPAPIPLANNVSAEILGVVTAFDEAEATFNGKPLKPGSAVRQGQLSLVGGTMKLRMESGVELSIVAPTKTLFHDSHQVELISGALTADVPDEVVGFAIKVPGLNVVDLGTTFGVNLPPGGNPQIHVFDGVVDAEVPGQDQRVRLTDDQTLLFDGTTLAKTEFDEKLFVQPEANTNMLPETSGDVRFLESPPNSVVRGQFEHDLILCFRERDESVTLKQEVPVSFDLPGRYGIYPRWQDFGAIPAGTRVDSYFVHLDAIGPEKKAREGSITFDRPVLGVVLSRTLLHQQNEIFGDTRTIYPPPNPNAKWRTTLESESITLSADRRTIRFRWFIRALTDQVRVLIDASEDNSKR